MGTNSAYIEISRTSQYVNKIRSYEVIVDDIERGTIQDGGTMKIELEPGEHEIRLKIDWCGSNRLAFRLQDNEVRKFRCGSPIKGWRYLSPFMMPYSIFFNKDKYLYIEAIDG
ncbi:hypothetical protein J19TS2_57150 [Cohnella xylanilytica]|uniref:hypothetical protein n=1 Tax=Cohnella xylanilytica TaxID=557555 RepID=UPI001B0ECB1C|nr:hypothetical protein [Cohnella xylanilytica]GIO16160.1 hypothetical protein J19TS2_57150 [Cohnella xylanilytica]